MRKFLIKVFRSKLDKQRPKNLETIFTDIYRQNLWGNSESISGPGSTVQRTAAFRQDFLELLQSIRPRTLLDAPCGDFNWMKEVPLDFSYIGIDIVRQLIEENHRQYNSSSRKFVCGDLINDELPKADIILCRDGLVHFSFLDIKAALNNFKKSGATYLLTNSFTSLSENTDIKTGDWRPINLQIAPFNLPQPIKVIDEKCLHTNGIYSDKILGLWLLKDIDFY